MNTIIIVVVIVFLLAILDGMATFIPTVCRNNQEIPEDESLTNKEERAWFDQHAKEVTLNSKDGLKLVGYEFRQQEKSDVWIVLIHGHRINAKLAMSPEFFYQKGWNVFCPDLRTHGKSQGKYIGMGWLDRKDILLWIHQIINENSDCKIVLFGGSMGGATVMMTAGENLPKEVKCGISDSGFTSAWELVKYILNHHFHLPAFPTLHLANVISRVLAGFSLKQASSVEQLKKSKLPMLFIHGTADQAVPFEMLEEVYEAAGGAKQKEVFMDAGHVASYRKEPERYWKCVFEFIEKYLG